jgi:NAD-dependent SIR2 family protein deacetylase
MFGESIAGKVKEGAEHAIEGSGRLLVLGTSLATYSAWRLARKAQERGMPIGILNLGGVRGEDAFFHELPMAQGGEAGVRIEIATEKVLPGVVEQLKRTGISQPSKKILDAAGEEHMNSKVFKDMLS